MTGGVAPQKGGGRASVKVTPMLAQYLSVKEQVGDAVLFFRLGDFFEMFFEDAERVAPVLDLTLTSRNKDDPNPIPMCGVPAHAAQAYVSRLVQQGFKVAICDQLGDPQAGPGLVERGLTRIITAGTVLDEEEGLGAVVPGYLVALAQPGTEAVAIATMDVSTGEVRCCRAPNLTAAREEIARIAPREVLVPAGKPALRDLAAANGVALTERVTAPPPPPSDPGGEDAEPPIEADLAEAIATALAYLRETVRGGLAHLRRPVVYTLGSHLMVDERTRRNLALLEGADGTRHGSLWWVLDVTATPMGSRCLRDWLVYPMVDLVRIGERLDGVESLVDAAGLRDDLAAAIAPAGDLERLVARLAVGRGGPREVARLGRALEQAAAVARLLEREGLPARLRTLREAALPPAGLAEQIAGLLADSLPTLAGEGGVIRAGADCEVDRLRSLRQDAQAHLAALEARERAATGIASLRIRYQRVFGYFFEVTKANLKLVPPRFTRRQTIASGERYTSPELLELERELASADDLCRRRELELFEALMAEVRLHERHLTTLAHALAEIDGLGSLAAVAHAQGYVRPRLHRGSRLAIRDGRHPVVERTSAAGRFVPNDVTLDDEEEQIAIVTGPNMAGKSTFLRQVALIVVLAHAGSFVPAAEAEIPLTDRIWTRVGAADDLIAGDSTFMVEMKETATILDQLTSRSLVVLDEIGRGTSTYDGIAIAWAVVEYLHDLVPAPQARVKTLFATHFHELTALADRLPRVRNLSVAVREWRGEVLFLRKVVAGPASRSFGIAVARLAGVPEAIVTRARELLHSLEAGVPLEGGPPTHERRGGGVLGEGQLDLFRSGAERLREELAAIEVERLTPLDALARLHALAEKAKRV
jgi:DNA mismatch repair protein MutS